MYFCIFLSNFPSSYISKNTADMQIDSAEIKSYIALVSDINNF